MVFGIREAAWPLIRRDLALSYLEVGLLLSVSDVVGTVVEPGFALLFDTGCRRHTVVGGGILFVLTLIAFAAAPSFVVLLAASALFSPASGAFVGMAQATWMDLEPGTTERNMARWVLSGSVGNLAGPLLLGLAVGVGAGWRAATLTTAVLAVPMVALAATVRYPTARHPEATHLRAAFRGAIAALRSRALLRWLALIQLTDLLGDVFLGFLALYLVDVAGASPQVAGVGVAVLAASSLVGDALLIRALRRMDGVRLIRWSAVAALAMYPAFLLARPIAAKIALLAVIGLLRAGWYAIPKARLFSELPARAGTAVAIGAPGDLVGSLFPAAMGAIAARLGLGGAMWLLVAAPISMLLLLPRSRR